jgi:hypothetical protein
MFQFGLKANIKLKCCIFSLFSSPKEKCSLMTSPTCLSVCVSVPLINFSFNHTKMADIQTSEVDAKLAPVNVGP